MKLYIDDDHIYDLVEGSIYTKNYNETLDSANVRISHLTSLLDIEPFDKVQLLFNNDRNDSAVNPYMLIDSFECIEETLDSEEGLDKRYYTYEISLFSCVKQLENIILPNITITPLQTNKRSVFYYLKQYLNEYSDGTLHFDDSVEARFGEDEHDVALIECPEMQWNTPTLREVFDDLMMVDDCICIIDNDTIKCMDLTEKGAEITNYNYIRRSMSSQDYVSDIKMNLQNAIETTGNIVSETIPFSTDYSYITNENFVLKTQFPIKEIKHLWMNFCLCADTMINNDWIYVCGDLMELLAKPLVCEYEEFQTKSLIYKPFLSSLKPGLDAYLYQNYCVYYNRYDNVIRGFNEVQDTGIFTGVQNKVQLLGYLIALKLGRQSQFIVNDGLASYSSTWFVIEYETIHESVFSASKDVRPHNKRTIMDNQTNSFVNTKVQAALEYQKANRLGNEQLLINQRVDNISNAIQLAQTYNDSIVYQTQYQCYSDHIEVNALATKNYILRNYFTGIKSHIRTWVNARDEAITRHELIKERYVFTYERNNENYGIFMTPLNYTVIKYVSFASCKIKSGNNYILGGSGIGYNIETISRILGKSICFTFGFDTNAVFKRNIDYNAISYANFDWSATQTDYLARIDNNFISNYGGIPTKNFLYVDSNYEFTSLIVSYYYKDLSDNTLKFFYIEGDTSQGAQYGIPGVLKDMVYDSLMSLDSEISQNVLLTREIVRHKDNKEIFKLSYQFEFGSSSVDEIYVGDKFIERQQIINRDTLNNNYRIFVANTLENSLPADAVEKSDAVMTVTNNSVNVQVGANSTQFIYICDSDSNIIVAFKYKQSTIYLNKEE